MDVPTNAQINRALKKTMRDLSTDEYDVEIINSYPNMNMFSMSDAHDDPSDLNKFAEQLRNNILSIVKAAPNK